jgi:hypothetical protein
MRNQEVDKVSNRRTQSSEYHEEAQGLEKAFWSSDIQVTWTSEGEKVSSLSKELKNKRL